MKKSGKKISIFEVYGTEVKNLNSYENRFEIVEGSKRKFDASTLKTIKRCVLRNTSSKEYSKDKLTLLIEATSGKKNWRIWVNLDSKSYKMYKDYVNCDIDPSKVCLYLLHDPEEEYGSEESDYTWKVCRILKDAVTSEPQSDENFMDDAE